MLPTPLLRFRVSKGQITPEFATISSNNLLLVGKLIEAYYLSIGCIRQELDNRISILEDEGADYKFVRGLSALLERMCLFEADSDMDPQKARKLVFSEASKRGVFDSKSRSDILKIVATKIGIVPDRLDQTLWSDVDNNLILKSFIAPDPTTLLKQYNLSLSQTLIFKSVMMSFTASDNWKNIFRDLKHLGLIYSAEMKDELLNVMVDGPLSLLKMVDRYGTSFAKLLPQIIRARNWTINADIISRGKQKRIYRFQLSSGDAKDLLPSSNIFPEQQYDSIIEKKFARSFNSFDSGWVMKREPEPLITGKKIMIPDFSFEKNGMKVYLEIAGFWTQEYLEKKIQKLNALEDIDIIVAVDEKLVCSKVKNLKGDVVLYSGSLPGKDIYRLLKKREENITVSQIKKTNSLKILIKGDYVKISDLAENMKVPVEALRYSLSDRHIVNGYLRVGDSFISEDKMERIGEKIAELHHPTLSEAQKIIDDEGVDENTAVVEALGYDVVWNGMDIALNRLVKRK